MTYPRLYILVRNDMDSMNSGKAIAQGAHAATKFVYECALDKHLSKSVDDWQKQGDGFGTKISLAVNNEEQLLGIVDSAKSMSIPANLVLDPTYPVRDGSVVHLIPVITAAYVFVRNEQDHINMNSTAMVSLSLYP